MERWAWRVMRDDQRPTRYGLACAYTEHTDEAGFCSDIALQDAVIRRLEILSCAAAEVSLEVRNLYEDLPWQEMLALKELLQPDHQIDRSLVWHTVKRNLPALLEQMRKAANAGANKEN